MSWPREVWAGPLLRGLDARARADLELAGAMRELAPGEPVFRAGEPADALCVVAIGRVEVRSAAGAGTRTATAGDAFGAEAALLAGGPRTEGAVATTRARVALIPLAVLRRAVGRRADAAAADGVAARMDRTLRRAATLELIASALGLAPGERVARLADAAEYLEVARGEVVLRAGEPAARVLFVARGALLAGDVHARVGDVVGLDEALAASPSVDTWVSAAPAHLVAVAAVVLRALLDADAARRARGPRHAVAASVAHRLAEARSMLVLDPAACVQCGHCVSSCAAVHADGLPRMSREGEPHADLVLATACQHCAHPACLPSCPTGAIARDARGVVHIRPELCTGCGACAKACPWDAIAMAPRGVGPGPLGATEVAQKCDLCADQAAGPACVAACPLEALARVGPLEALARVAPPGARREAEGAPRGARIRAAWTRPEVLSAVGLALGAVVVSIPRVVGGGARASGGVAAVGLAVLAAYPLVKRGVRARLRGHFLAHLAVGVIAAGAVAAHAGARWAPTLAGALAVVFWGATLAGLWGALAYAVVPPALSRLAPSANGGAARGRAREAALHRALGEGDEVTKAIFARVLVPYVRAPWTPLSLIVRGHSAERERGRLRGELRARLAAMGIDEARLAARGPVMDELVRVAVDVAVERAQNAGARALRVWLAPHVVLAVLTVVLGVVHGVVAARMR